MWIQLAIMIVSALIQYALTARPKPPQTDSNLTITPVKDGQPIVVVFGDVNLDPVTLWYGNPASTEIRTKGSKK